jgi:hypothetical protein
MKLQNGLPLQSYHISDSPELRDNMPRPRQRVCLENGLSLDLKLLARQRIIRFGAATPPVAIKWTNTYTGAEVASGTLAANMSDFYRGWLRIQIGEIDQQITLVARPRHFGGRQWFFLCPDTARRATVLWFPHGARYFCCRERWGRQVAYSSQFSTPTDRAHRGKAKINSRLCAMGGFNPDEWEIPAKPKWTRWRTYDRMVEKFDRYEALLDRELFLAVARIMRRVR